MFFKNKLSRRGFYNISRGGLTCKQKKVMNPNTGLQKIFHCFRAIERSEISKFNEEYLRHGKGAISEDVDSLK